MKKSLTKTEVRQTTLPSLTSTLTQLPITYPQQTMVIIHTHAEIKVNGQTVQKLECKQKDGWTQPIALSCPPANSLLQMSFSVTDFSIP